MILFFGDGLGIWLAPARPRPRQRPSPEYKIYLKTFYHYINIMFMSKHEFDMDDEEHPCNCFICNDKKKHLNDTIKVLPEHITQNIVYFIGCKSCLKTFEMLDLSQEIEKLKKQRNKKMQEGN